MQDKMKLLLEKINTDIEYYKYFEDATLNKIEGKKKTSSYFFHITLMDILPVDVYDCFCNQLKQGFNQFEIVKPIFCVEKFDDSTLSEYFNYLIEKYSVEYPLLKAFIDSNVNLSAGILTVEVSNKAEKMKLKSVNKQLVDDLKSIGYGEIELNIKIDEAKSKEIFLEIEKSKVIEVKREEKPFEIIKGNEIKKKITPICDILYPDDDTTIEACIFGTDFSERPTTNIITLKVTDGTDSIYCKMFERKEEEYRRLTSVFKEGKWYKIRGSVQEDKYSGELSLFIKEVMSIRKEVKSIKDTASEKRIELHTHTFMTKMDGLVDAKKLVNTAIKWGHKAIAITDKDGAQAFPDVFNLVRSHNKGLPEGEEPFKVIYGTELTMVNDEIDIVVRSNDSVMLDNTYVVFDFETTGLNAGGEDSIIEIGAVKMLNGEIIDTFSELINPGKELNPKITEITGITDKMLEGKRTEEEVFKDYRTWFGDLPMVAHNAKFDASFIERAFKVYNLGPFTNPVIDTMSLYRVLDGADRASLSVVAKKYEVSMEENDGNTKETHHHRGEYDATITALIFHKMLKKMNGRNIEKMSDLQKMISKEDIIKYGETSHINILSRNKEGLKNLFKIISLANTTYLVPKKGPRILKSEIQRLREGLLIGSGCYESEVFKQARTIGDTELADIINFYDYVEVQPIECYDHLIQRGDFGNPGALMEHIKKIIRNVELAGKYIVATGDVHHLTKEDKVYREIIVNQKVPGGGLHPLARKDITRIPSMHFRTTDEMLENFNFLDEEIAKKLVIDNPKKIADLVEIYDVIIQTGGIPFSPKIENSVEIVTDMVYGKAKSMYGDPLPTIIEERIKSELNGILASGYDVIYLIAQKLVKKSNDDGYVVGSRGSVGSSFVATMMGITEVNPLPAHYVCEKCKKTIFEEDGKMFSDDYPSGYDLPDKICECGNKMFKEGQDMPFATFLGFNADKVPDIDLNFSSEYQPIAHEYTKELFGEDNVYRAGTVGTVADKTAFGFVKGYCEDKGITMRTAEIERLASGCTGVKRTTGQHPGGIVVIPDYMDIYDFTPFQYPAEDNTAAWRTTHFEYHSLEEDILKLDILGHDDPTMLKVLQDLSGVDINTLPMDDPKIISIFSSPNELGVTEEQIMCKTGSQGLPETGTRFVINMLSEVKPTSFADLVKISGLSHGTDVWAGNAQELIRTETCTFKEVIGCRDDMMIYLSAHGLAPIDAFKIMEMVRKGRHHKDKEGWAKYVDLMRSKNIPEWYIASCGKIKYMFPKAHATAYVMMAVRVAWFKVYHPIWYYAAYFSVRCADFDIEAMIKGYDAIKNKINEISSKGFNATNKENSILDVLGVALEASARGFKFGDIDINRSDANNFIIDGDNTLIPPFRTIDGLGDTVAKKIVEEREKAPFLSIEDFQKRGKVSTTIIDKMRSMGVLDGMDESSQLSLF